MISRLFLQKKKVQMAETASCAYNSISILNRGHSIKACSARDNHIKRFEVYKPTRQVTQMYLPKGSSSCILQILRIIEKNVSKIQGST